MAKPKYIETPEKMWYVYAHMKNENTPFYIGIGKKVNYKRAFEHKGRNDFWERIVSKYPCYSSILYSNLTHNEACEIEINLISYFGRVNNNTGILCNLTDGGEGGLNVVFTEERKQRIRIANTGKKHKPETIEKFRLRKQTEATKEKIKLLKTGIKASEETKLKMSKSSMGKNNPACISRRKPVMDINTGKIYNSATEAALSIGVSKSYMIGMLIGRYNNKTSMTYA